MEMTPPKEQMHFEFISSAGMFPTKTVGVPGTQGAAVAGTQGMGVRTPSAAAVAAATVGFAMLVHMPKGAMFTKGLLSMMLAMGIVCKTRLAGSTISEEGATPNEHCVVAPMHASVAIPHPPSFTSS